MTLRRSGFTLLETLLAVGLVVALCAAAFSFLLSLGDRRGLVEREGRARHELGTTLSRIAADLSCAVAGDAALGGGIVGDGESIRILSRTTDLDAAVRGAPEGRADLVKSEYRFDSGALTVSRRAVGAGEPTDGRLERACDGLRRVRLRYHDGRGWNDRFDSQRAGALPVAVELRLWRGAPLDSDRTMPPPDEVLVVAIPDARGEGS